MKIRLTVSQYEALRRLVGSELRYSLWLDQATENRKRSRDVVLPAVGWLRIQDELKQRCFNVHGRRSSKVPTTWGTMLKRVARSIADRQGHPAMHGQGLVGRWGELLPVWQTPNGLSQFPVLNSPFGVLVPTWSQAGGLTITTWSVQDPPMDDPILDERQHLAFGIVSN